ncbi:kunitz-type serine protease inhibitor 6-like isoform X2 [Amblyomma americanum]
MKLYLILAFIGAALADAKFESQCAQKPDPGFCKARLPRWFLNTTTGKCEKFSYSGCGGNQNRFLIKEKCELTCITEMQNHLLLSTFGEKKARKPAFVGFVCSRPPYTGLCKALVPRFYFDSRSKSCRPFIYGGCDSNGNNFATIRDCMDTCGAGAFGHTRPR